MGNCISDISDFSVNVDIDQVIAGEARLSLSQAIGLYKRASLTDLGRWASAVADRIHGEEIRSYVIDRNINYTNVCSAGCRFCAFRADDGGQQSYVLSMDQVCEKVSQLEQIGGTQVLLQGGMHPELGLEYYEDLLRGVKTRFPQIQIHGFSPPEFVHFVCVFDIDGFPTPGAGRAGDLSHDLFLAKLEVIIKGLRECGLDSIPGGGGEIFADHVRRRIGPGKATGAQWLDVMRVAQKLGMVTSATMMFGHIEGIADRFEHMQMIRDAQDEAIKNNWAGRYLTFVAWPFQKENTELGRLEIWDNQSGDVFPGDLLAEKVLRGELPGAEVGEEVGKSATGKLLRLAGASDYLRVVALSRLFFDNIDNIGSSLVTMGPKVGQIGLKFGANDLGTVMLEENVVSAAGTDHRLNEAVVCRLIRQAGFIPAQRDYLYQFVKVHQDDGPDLPPEVIPPEM